MEHLSFEDAFERLEATVRQLEAGDLTIDEAVLLYEQGVQLAQFCQQHLDATELRIKRLIPSSTGGYDTLSWDNAELKA